MMNSFITYSPAHTIVPTYECFNRCSYCNFRVNPGGDTWLTLEKAAIILKKLQRQKISEILILSGEVHPHSPRRSAWFRQIYELCNLAISLGFLPHTNAGLLSFSEMARLKLVNASMGLMLEQLAPKLRATVHRHAPSKIPQLRRQQLEWAGKLGIPFTSGLLLGIGETAEDCWETLAAIADIHQRWGHIQEVILQPYSAGQQQSFTGQPFDLRQLPAIVARAREILPPAIEIQIPPNLVSTPAILLDCLAAGARDLGGISIKDEVNPDYPHPQIQSLAQILQPAGWQLRPRLPVYPQYFSWLSPPLEAIARQMSQSRLCR